MFITCTSLNIRNKNYNKDCLTLKLSANQDFSGTNSKIVNTGRFQQRKTPHRALNALFWFRFFAAGFSSRLWFELSCPFLNNIYPNWV